MTDLNDNSFKRKIDAWITAEPKWVDDGDEESDFDKDDYDKDDDDIDLDADDESDK